MTTFQVIYAVLAGGAVVISVMMTLLHWETGRYFGSRAADTRRPSEGRVRLVVPIKGANAMLGQCLAAMLSQDHGDYDVVFVVEDMADTAVPIIKAAMAGSAVESWLLVAGRTTATAQKLHNLRSATEDIPDEISILAFADADIQPRPDWLRRLVLVLHDGDAATGYRWLVPQRTSFASLGLYAVNNGVIGLVGLKRRNLVWGGTWAVGRELFVKAGIRDAWRNALADDVVAARRLWACGANIAFEPGAISVTAVDMSSREIAAFLRRQFMSIRLYAGAFFAMVLAATAVTQLAFWIGVAMTAAGLVAQQSVFWLAPVTAALLYALGVVRGTMRGNMARMFVPDALAASPGAARFDRFGGPITGVFVLVAVVSALVGNSVVWRGTRYSMDWHGRVLSVSRDYARGTYPGV